MINFEENKPEEPTTSMVTSIHGNFSQEYMNF